MLYLYNFFHLNLMYSALSKSDRLTVLNKCYWPLLELVRDLKLPVGIEISGCTLEIVDSLAPDWTKELRGLIDENICELIGCGYSQVIGPLVPARVTAANLQHGHYAYQKFLGAQPKIALLNEQAFSSGLVPIYKAANYEAIIMEWNNPFLNRHDWDSEWRYFPQRARGTPESDISLIWNKSISFQKFQRYAHGDIELNELLAYIETHIEASDRALPLYGNDVEVFDFRPGRYMTEARIHSDGEWNRIHELYRELKKHPSIQLIMPSQVLDIQDGRNANHLLDLGSPSQPIPVKKQDKYNVVRWAVSGRNDLDINSRCWCLYNALATRKDTPDTWWRELCYLWSSDFRTHIQEERWNEYLIRLSKFEAIALDSPKKKQIANKKSSLREPPSSIKINRTARWLDVEAGQVFVRFNCRRGLSVDSYTDYSVSDCPLFGTLPHGFFDDIRYGADYYSGHLVLEMPAEAKITDLVPVDPKVIYEAHKVIIECQIATKIGVITKKWTFDSEGGLMLDYQWDSSTLIMGSLRLGYVTIFPDAFDCDESFCFGSHNGGGDPEWFGGAQDFDHGGAVSFLVSANQAVGMTEGWSAIGDEHQQIVLKCDKSVSALVGMVQRTKVAGRSLNRLALSARELDDTSKPTIIGPFHARLYYKIERLFPSVRQ